MAENTVRTVVIFGIISLVLAGAAVGGVLLMKARNNSYASSRAQSVAQNNTAKQSTEKKDEGKKNDSQPAQSNQNQQSQAPATTATPTPSSSQTQSSSRPVQNAPQGGSGATPDGSMPATGPSDVVATMIMLMLAVFFSGKLIRARADYRRYVGL